MTTNNYVASPIATADVSTQAADISAALRKLKPNEQHRKNQLFILLYPVIREMLDQNVTQKAILEKLAESGLKMHPSRFKELMDAEAKTNSNEATKSENDTEVVAEEVQNEQ